ncbi:GH116 family glycosyl-hydrolase [Paenibacillaceae bacterium WGS1546]|uniref:GH116 family glycosyl-hydrolase n=1 Tax=Cohnella sp. WGS1546 TaxID=3366810 RepID=UPI00372D69E1
MAKVIAQDELYQVDKVKSYPSDARETAFLLGGIGTGNISIGSRGQLKDWEIFNWPGKNTKFPFSFFALWAKPEGADKPIAKILESRLHPPYTSSHGYIQHELVNLPRFEDAELTCEYPFANVTLKDSEMPVSVQMEAFTPFIPLNSKDSGLPSAIVRYKVKNSTDKKVDVTVVGTLPNASGFEGYDVIDNLKLVDKVKNEWRDQGKIKGLYYQPESLDSSHIRYGNMAFMTTDENVTYKTEWFDGEWVDGIQDFWDDFTSDGRLEPVSTTDTIGCEFAQFHDYSFLVRKEKVGSMGIYKTLEPGEEKTFEFIISWYFPNRVSAWIEFDDDIENFKQGKYPSIKNYYATQFNDAWDAGRYLLENLERLEKHSRDFHRAMFRETTLPGYVIDAITSNITTLRSNTCFRIEDGTFLGYEGIRDYVGCGLGSVPHVWNYAQTVAFLFPDLEQSMRRVEFGMETDDTGRMSTRMLQVLGQERYQMVPACDGQLGSVVRFYREFKLTGDVEFLKSLWDKVAKALDYAFEVWDTDGDFVLDGQQNTTYDIEFYGPNPMTDFIFLAALKAGSEMAKIVGDEEHYKKYSEAFELGSKRADELMFDGEYYVQVGDKIDTYRYQYGKGCLSDQLLGQFLAHVSGLSHILPQDHVKKAVKAIFDHNFRTDFYNTDSVHRAYALNDEQGLVTCSWPRGGRPTFPLSYSGEVWTGIEYQVASHLIYEGFVEEGLTMVRAIRDRYDGYKRNPFSEVESGHHYTRAMASWALLPALSGFEYDMYAKKISFNPKMHAENFSTFWSTGTAWGIYKQRKDEATGEVSFTIETLYGNLDGVSVNQA